MVGLGISLVPNEAFRRPLRSDREACWPIRMLISSLLQRPLNSPQVRARESQNLRQSDVCMSNALTVRSIPLSCCAIFDVSRCSRSRTVRTAEETAANLDSVSDDSASAMLADRGYRLDSTFEAVKRMPRASGNQFKTLVVIVSANFAHRHVSLLQKKRSGTRCAVVSGRCLENASANIGAQ